MDLWFRQLGFYNNPFSIKPGVFHDEIFGNKELVDSALEKVKEGSVVFISGDFGSGKTSVLKRIIKRFGGKKQVVYYSCNRTENEIDFEELLKGKYGFFGRLFGKRSSNMILLLDEAQDLSKDDSLALVGCFNNSDFKSIILVSKDYKLNGIAEDLKNLIGDNIVRLGDLTEDEAIDMIRRRIGYIKILSDDVVKYIFEKVDKNPRKMLGLCEDVCRHAVNNCETETTTEHVDLVLREK